MVKNGPGVAHRPRRLVPEQPLHHGVVVERERQRLRHPLEVLGRGWPYGGCGPHAQSLPPGAGSRCESPRAHPVHFPGAPRPDRRPRGPCQGRQPGAGHGLHRGEGRRPAGGGRPAPRPARRDPGRQRRGRGRRRGRRDDRPRSSTASASPTCGSWPWPTGCARWRRCPIPSARSPTAGCGPNGLRVQRVRVPLGVVAIIYENRPNVTSDAFGLCLKSGNAAFLRGSSGAIRSNIAIAAALREGLAKAGLPARLARAGRGHPPRGGRRVHAPARVRSTC